MKKQFLLLFVALLLATLSSWATTTKVKLYASDATSVGGIATSTEQSIGTGAWKNDQSKSKMELYLPLTSLGSFKIDDIASLQFSTKKALPIPATPNLDFFWNIYTNGTKYSWYEERIASEPMYYNGFVSLYNAWTTYKSIAGPNQMTFFDSNYGPQGWYNAPTLTDLQAGAINWATKGGTATTSIDYGAQTVKYISLATGSSWNATMLSYLDNIIITLNNGNVLIVDLEERDPTPTATIQAPIQTTCGAYDVQVKVSDFKNVGAISMKLAFDAAVLAYQTPTRVDLNPAISSADFDVSIPGKFNLGWNSLTGITLADNDILFTLHFNLLPVNRNLVSSTDLTWSPVPGDCEFAAPGGKPIYVSTFNPLLIWTIPARPVVNTTTHLEYCKIQDAINAASSGNTITVAAGTYAENVIIDKPLTLLGAQAGIDPRSDSAGGPGTRNQGTPTGETVVIPGIRNLTAGNIFTVQANNVTIDGFWIDGTNLGGANPLLTSGTGLTVGSTEEFAINGIYNGNDYTHTYFPITGALFQNNIVKNFSALGISFDNYNVSVSHDNLITKNFVTNLNGGGWYNGSPTAIALLRDGYASVTNNEVTNSIGGIVTENNFASASGMSAPVISGNDVSTGYFGIWHNSTSGTAPVFTISDNVMRTWDPGIGHYGEWNLGLWLSTIMGTAQVNVTDNTIMPGAYRGIQVIYATAGMTIHGGSVSGARNTGILVYNIAQRIVPVPDQRALGSWGAAGQPTTVTLDGVSVSGSAIGVRAWDNGGTQTVTMVLNGSSITGGTTGLQVDGALAHFGTLGNAAISGQSGNYIELINNTGNIDATAVSFDGQTGTTATVAQNYAIEDKIVHKIDNSALGFVLVKANNDYVTVNSFVSPTTTAPSIQRGVDAASSGWTVNVGPGTFTENVIVSKSLTLNGNGQASTFVIPAISSPNSLGGSLYPGASNIFLVQANDVTIQNLTADGDNPGLTSGIVRNSADLDARNGIITDHLNFPSSVFNNLNVNHVTVKNIYLRGMYASTGGSFNFHDNTVTNVNGETSSIALFNWGGAGAFTNNTVSDAKDAISSNHSTGTTYSGNTVSNSGSGIHTDSNGDGGGTADVIENNTISNSPANGYGIFVFAPYKNVLVQANTITNVEIGLTCAGSYAPGVIPIFTQNTVDGQMKANSIGVYSTTEIWGYTSGNQNVLFTNNFIKNNVKGFLLASELGFTNTTTANSNSVTGNTTGVKLVNNYLEGASTGAFVLDMECNWWGATSSTAVATAVTTTDSRVDYTPWLGDGTDDAPLVAGFQPVSGSCDGTPVVIETPATITNVSCPGSSNGAIAINLSGGKPTFTFLWTPGGATAQNPSGLSAGTYSVTVTDAYGSTATLSDIVVGTVPDVTPPVITCPASLTVNMNSGCSWVGSIGTATATDNCTATDNIIISSNAPSSFPLGVTTVIWTAKDASNITATCNQTVTVSYNTLSGTLKYNNNAQTPMNKVKLRLLDSGSIPVGSDITTAEETGAYAFTGLCAGTYTISVIENLKDVGGINSTDAAAVNAWASSGGTIEFVQFLAGDVATAGEGNLWINNQDALRIQKYFVFGATAWPFDRASWSYWKKGVTISNNGSTPANFNVTVSGANVTNFDLYGMCTGDFNGSLIPTTLKSATWSMELNNNSTMNAGSNQEFELPMRAASAMQVGAISMILQIPSGLVNVQNVLVNGSTVAPDWAVNGDELRIGWYSSTPVNVAENGNLLTLKLKSTNAFTVGESMEFALKFDPLNELADGNSQVIQGASLLVAQVGNGLTGIQNPTDNAGLSLSNYPNPFKGSTTVNYKLPIDGKVTIQVYNSLGQVVKSLVDANQNAGDYSIRMDGNNLMPGIYIAKLRLTNTSVDMTGTVKLSVLK